MAAAARYCASLVLAPADRSCILLLSLLAASLFAHGHRILKACMQEKCGVGAFHNPLLSPFWRWRDIGETARRNTLYLSLCRLLSHVLSYTGVTVPMCKGDGHCHTFPVTLAFSSARRCSFKKTNTTLYE